MLWKCLTFLQNDSVRVTGSKSSIPVYKRIYRVQWMLWVWQEKVKKNGRTKGWNTLERRWTGEKEVWRMQEWNAWTEPNEDSSDIASCPLEGVPMNRCQSKLDLISMSIHKHHLKNPARKKGKERKRSVRYSQTCLISRQMLASHLFLIKATLWSSNRGSRHRRVIGSTLSKWVFYTL